MSEQAPVGSSGGRPLLRGEVAGPHGGILRRFPKGVSGNPHGTNMSAYHAARRICAQATPDAARKQVALMNSEDERVAFMATVAVLERGAGKPRDRSDEDNALSRLNLAALSDDEQRLLLGLLRRVMGVESPARQMEASAEAGAAKIP